MEFQVIGLKTERLDANKLACGRGTFVEDADFRGLLHAAFKFSPVAHARILKIDTSKAEALTGVHCVLHHGNVTRVPYTCLLYTSRCV